MMKNVFLVVLAFFFLSCQSQDKTEVFSKEKAHFDKAVEYLKSSYSLLYSSECTEKIGISIDYYSVAKMDCYPKLKDNLSSMLALKMYSSIDVISRDNILFELDFVPNDEDKTEITKYYLYFEAEKLPEQYQSWIGAKEKLADNWWYLEYTNSQF